MSVARRLGRGSEVDSGGSALSEWSDTKGGYSSPRGNHSWGSTLVARISSTLHFGFNLFAFRNGFAASTICGPGDVV